MMNEKWTCVFKLIDFNKDGVISSKDRDACIQSFLTTYKPEGKKKEKMVTELNTFWDQVLFLTGDPDWSQSFTLDEILRTRQEAYDKNPEEITSLTKVAMTHLLTAANTESSKSFSFENFKRMHEAFNLKDETFIHGVYGMVGPDAGGNCFLEDIVEFYTELTMGSDQNKHQQYKSALIEIGFLPKA